MAMINNMLRSLQPDGAAELALVNKAARESTDPELLELCRCLIVALLEENAIDRATSVAYSPLERAALDYTEQFVISVSTISDQQVEALRSHLGDEKTYAFAAALYVIEATERLRIISGVVFGDERDR